MLGGIITSSSAIGHERLCCPGVSFLGSATVKEHDVGSDVVVATDELKRVRKRNKFLACSRRPGLTRTRRLAFLTYIIRRRPMCPLSFLVSDVHHP